MAAGNAIIGALRAVLGIDTAQFETGLKSAQSHLSGFGAGVAKAGAAAAVAFAAAGVAVAVAVKGAINEADKLNKASQKIGVPVEELSALKFAADLADVSFEGLEKGLVKLSKAMVEAAAKPTSEAANAFKALGVSATDGSGKLKSSSEVLQDVAGKFEGLKDGAGKTAVSVALFGKAGADLIPLLNAGKDGLQEMADEARQLGIVIDGKTAKSAEEFNDNLTRLGKVKDGIIVKITAGMLPALEQLSKNMVATAKDTEGLSSVGQSLGEWLTGSVSLVAHFSLGIRRLGVEWQAFTKLFTTVPFTDAWTKAWQEFQAVDKQTQTMFANLRSRLSDATVTIGTTGAALEVTSKAQKDFNFAALGGKKALDQYLDSVRKSREGQVAQAAGFGQVAGTAEAFRVVLQGLAVAKAASIVPDQARLTQLYQEAFATQDLAMKMAGLQLVASNMKPWEIFQQAMLQNQVLFDAGKISAETLARANEDAANRAGYSWQAASTSLASSFGEIGSSMGQLSDNWARLAKIGQAIGASVAFVNAYVAASEAFAKTPFPANIAIAAGVLAKGLTMAAAIKGAAFTSAAMGGAFRVGGGLGGGDSKLVQMALEPGELVEVSSNREGGYQSGGGPKEIVVRGISLRDFVSGGQMIEILNQAVGDGHRFRMA